MRVAVAWSPAPGEAVEAVLELPDGATVADAIRAAGQSASATDDVGIWGRAATSASRLVDGDRVELYRPLTVDPMEARRRRAGKKRAGR